MVEKDADLHFVISSNLPESSEVLMEFADGYPTLPKWLVAHLGGTNKV